MIPRLTPEQRAELVAFNVKKAREFRKNARYSRAYSANQDVISNFYYWARHHLREARKYKLGL
jgi:hypothetical protein